MNESRVDIVDTALFVTKELELPRSGKVLRLFPQEFPNE